MTAPLRLLGLDASDNPVLDTELPHGGSPDITTWDAGFVLQHPLRADRETDGTVVVRLRLAPRGDERRPRDQVSGRDRGLVLEPGEQPEIRQRIAAYAVVRSDRGLLATQFSSRTAAEGRWGLAGGGIDDGEQPRDAVLREVHEETSQRITLGELIAINTAHWVGRSPRHTVEDFHAVRLVYAATCAEPSEPVILDVGGTTSQARWIGLDQWGDLNWTGAWRDLLRRVLPAA